MKQILIAIFACWAIAAVAQTLHGVTEAPKVGGGAAVTPSACNGTIDLSTGCTMPMLGGL